MTFALRWRRLEDGFIIMCSGGRSCKIDPVQQSPMCPCGNNVWLRSLESLGGLV